jgi:hypothetical protein
LLSSDGATYAYDERVFGPTPLNGPGPGPIATRIHVVDVATNKNRTLIDGPTFWSVVANRNQLVYMMHPCYGGCGSDSGGLWTLIGSDAAWAGDPKSGGLARLDLASRAVTIWFKVAAKALDPIGLDRLGHPPDGVGTIGAIVDTDRVWFTDGGSIYLVTPDGRTTEVGALPSGATATSPAPAPNRFPLPRWGTSQEAKCQAAH